MSAPVTTKSADISYYPLADPTWVPGQILSVAIDALGAFAYGLDSRNTNVESARVLRFDLVNLVADIWLASGTLPVLANAPCFTHDFTGILFSVRDEIDFHLYRLDFISQVVTDLGDTGLGGNAITEMSQIPGTADQYLIYRASSKQFGLLTWNGVGPFTLDPTHWHGLGWSSSGDYRNGSLYRTVQNGGPGTVGPIVKHVAARGDITEIIAGYFSNDPETNGADAFHAIIRAVTLRVNDDASVVYFSSDPTLRMVTAGLVSEVAGPAPGVARIVGYDALNNHLLTNYGFSVNVWS